ncbi:MAG: hypothetical protein WC829_04365 [Hyphomicrobium sp.]|jgi:hypothetical protein
MKDRDFLLTQERLKDLLHYDPQTGLFLWRKQRMGRMKPGDEAGTLNADGLVMICIDSRLYTAGRLAVFYMTGEWPKGRVRYKDGDKQNLRFKNMVDEKTAKPMTRAAAYQRQWRKDRVWIERRIMSDPEIYEEWTANPRATVKKLRQQRRDEQMRYFS